MGINRKNLKPGFTIIETSLVLAISALLAVGMMVGWMVTINRQRYNDSVNTLQSDIQRVFAEVENPENSKKPSKYHCVDGGANISITANNTLGVDRGTSNCIMIGKMISFSSGIKPRTSPDFATEFTVQDVIGLDIDPLTACGGSVCNNDIDALRATKFVVSATSASGNDIGTQRTEKVQWGGAYKMITDNRNSGSGRQFTGSITGAGDSIYSVLILRSPLGGSTKVFGVAIDTISDSSSYYTNTGRQQLRERYVSEQALVTETKKVDICLGQKYNSATGGADNTSYARSRVIRVGGTSSSVEISPLNGSGSVSCDGSSAFSGVVRS